MKSPLLRLLLALSLFSLSASTQKEALPPWMARADEIQAVLMPDKSPVMVGEPVFATLILKNESGRDLQVSFSRRMVQSGMTWTAKESVPVTAVDNAGMKVVASDWERGDEGSRDERLGKIEKFPASGKLALRVCLSGWVVFDHPGNYTITAAPVLSVLNIDPSKTGYQGIKGMATVPISAVGTLRVIPADDAKLAAVIDALAKQAASGADNAPTHEAVEMMETAPDARAIPWLRAEALNVDSKLRFEAVRALSLRTDDAALAALKDVLGSTTPGELGAYLCFSLLRDPNPGAVALLQSRADDKDALVAAYARASQGIAVTLVPEKAAILPGEPVNASLVVKNNSKDELNLETTGDYPTPAGGEGLEDVIKLVALDKDGVPAPKAPRCFEAAHPMFETRSRHFSRSLPAEGSAEVPLFLPWRVVLDKPGSYTLVVTARLKFSHGREAGAQQWAQNLITIPVKVTAPLEVLAPDKEKIGQLIDGLEKMTSALPEVVYNGNYPPHWKEMQDAEHKLEWIADERVIPYFLKKMRSEHYSEWIVAIRAIAKFNNDAALDALKDDVEIPEIINPASHQPDKNALTQVHMTACDALTSSPHPGAIAYLLTQQKNPDLQVRIKVMGAVATRLPAEQAIPILEKMQDDPEKWVGDYARRYVDIIKAGNVEQIRRGLQEMEGIYDEE